MIKVFLSFFILCVSFTVQGQNDSIRRISNNLKSKGNFFTVQKKFSTAFHAYQKAITIDSTNGISYYKMYRAQLLLNKDSALYYLKKTFLYTPFLNDSLLLELSHYYLNHGNYLLATKYQQKHNKLYNTNNSFNYKIRQHHLLLDSNFRKRTILFLPLSSYQIKLNMLIPFLLQTKFKCKITSYQTGHKNSYKNLEESKANSSLVQQYLINKGVSKSNIKVINYGSSTLLVEPKDLLSSKYNNRVEVEILW